MVYDINRSYDWNYAHPPDPVECEIPEVPGRWQFCGKQVASPLGIPAGPLLNGRWCLYYASLGFDVLTYKTVRSRERACFPLPNLQPVSTSSLTGNDGPVTATELMHGSWAVSFGMPSRSPEVWRADVEQTRNQLPRGKLLVVSVVASEEPGWGIDSMAADYARCARWAVESGADAVELNLSCPNVATSDGQLFQHPAHAGKVVAEVRSSIGTSPLLVKVGRFADEHEVQRFLDPIVGMVDGISTLNCVAMRVADSTGQLMFRGQPRGIAGIAIFGEAMRQVRFFARELERRRNAATVVGVGGIATCEHVLECLASGASAVQIATAAICDPLVAIRIKSDWSNQWSNAQDY